MTNNFNYREWVSKFDKTDPNAIVNGIKDMINDENMVSEQKLYAIGLLIDGNKENYILSLKNRNDKLSKEIKSKDAQIDELTEKMKAATSQQKVVKRYVINK